jgi:hypothetical protein
MQPLDEAILQLLITQFAAAEVLCKVPASE